MSRIITVTPNPAIDISTSVSKVLPLQKLRCGPARRDPGGGGVNVARVFRRLGGAATAVYPAGGATGQLLRRLVDREGLSSVAIEINRETREDFTVTEEASGRQYRFVLPGPPLSESEWKDCLNAVAELQDVPFVVASGSLSAGIPDDFYARVAEVAKRANSKVVIDSGGRPLAAALEEGLYLIKPNLRELQELVSTTLTDQSAWVAASRSIISRGGAEIVALTLGGGGALLITATEASRAQAPEVPVVSAVGAGDSFLGAMVWSLATGKGVTNHSVTVSPLVRQLC